MKAKINIRDYFDEAESNNRFLLAHASIDVDDLFDTNNIAEEQEIDIHEILAEQRAVALVFSIDDVKKLRPDLDDEKAWDVLQQFEAAAQDCPDPMHESMLQLAEFSHPKPKARQANSTKAGKVISDYDPNGDERENLVDLLTDTMHWCEGFGEPFEEFYGTAKMHFTEESKTYKKGE